MEESEKRRERLNAMRTEAAQTRETTHPHNSLGGLSNPLIESESASTAPLHHTSQRFDFYTDPMAAFSGSKRRNNISPQFPQTRYNTPPQRPLYEGMLPPPPVYQNTHVNAPGQRILPVPEPYFNQGSPPHFNQGPPPHFNQGPPPHFNQGPHFNQSPRPNFYQSPQPHSNQSPRPHFNQSPRPNFNQNHVNYATPPNFPRGGNNFTSPSFRQGDSSHTNYGRGRGEYNSNSHNNSGRGGRGRSQGNRGAGSHNSVSADQRPDLYYRKEMVEDPWKMLTPVIWKGVDALGSDQSWLPKSIAVKRAKVSPEAAKTSISQQSLAEYLAASFNDSTDEAVDEQPDL
ncbi:hypothetical protein ABFS82_03G056800 [Erythranthe guttata]|uniref:RNA-binding protein EWS n=1 Tax=Erythranthe guttata TaxID=4155 RepID=UPI00064E12D1|nr:PREDICTED: RNA-binding protein EWS [Erythranthe guttata]|eukprot:XP_012846656.1 PREDICTED: RNA-binding protein EWS [Erythranthe guttata]